MFLEAGIKVRVDWERVETTAWRRVAGRDWVQTAWMSQLGLVRQLPDFTQTDSRDLVED